LEDLRRLVQPGEYIITDYPIMAFRAGLLVPPDLCDPGTKRILAGELTMADLVADIERYHPPAVVIWGKVSAFIYPNLWTGWMSTTTRPTFTTLISASTWTCLHSPNTRCT